MSGPFWTDEASRPGGEDSITLYAFTWDDPAPEHLEKLLRAAAVAIDAWIAERL